MSKIGKINISIPDKVKVALAGNIINIEGPLGKKSINIDLDMFNLDIKEGKEISIKPKEINQNSKIFTSPIFFSTQPSTTATTGILTVNFFYKKNSSILF